MASEHQRDLIGGGLKLILFATAIYILIDKVIMRQIELIYPYVTYEMVDMINIWLIVSFFIPGILCIILAYFGKYFDPTCNQPLPTPVKISFIITAILSLISVIGIRTGVAILLNIKGDSLDDESEDDNLINKEASKSYILYMIASGLYLLIFGLFFLALIEFLLVITYPLFYPTLTQPLMIGLEIWFWLCLMVPAILFFIMSIILTQSNDGKNLDRYKLIIKIGSVLAIFGIFGFSNGLNLIQSQWMLEKR